MSSPLHLVQDLPRPALIAGATALGLGVLYAGKKILDSQSHPLENPWNNQGRIVQENTLDELEHGGVVAAIALKTQGVRFIFTLTGGHIAPLLVGCDKQGIRVIDVRHEVNTVFAADAVSRLSGIPGVAIVTAGPGLTNTITAIKNAQLAQSPVILFGGATSELLRGRGSLQDIDQFALLKPHVKWTARVSTVRQMAPIIEEAFWRAKQGVPGPVFIEFPIDVLYPKTVLKSQIQPKIDSFRRAGQGLSPSAWVYWGISKYLERHVENIFAQTEKISFRQVPQVEITSLTSSQIDRVLNYLYASSRPVFVIGAQAVQKPEDNEELARSLEKFGLPIFLSSMARGLLGPDHPLHMKHKRKEALKSADFVLLAGVPCDFRLEYGEHLNRNATYISLNEDLVDLYKNKTPTFGSCVHPQQALIDLAKKFNESKAERWSEWVKTTRDQHNQREVEIQKQSQLPALQDMNSLALCKALDKHLGENSILIGDGGDFVGTASYIVRPRGALTWLDPGPFGTLGVGAGFALGAKLVHPESEVWIIYGDGSCGYSIAEFDSFVKHNLPVIAVVGNDGKWGQMYRDQVKLFGSDVGATLRRCRYEDVAKAWDAEGILLNHTDDCDSVFEKAKSLAAAGKPVLINALIGPTNFRDGSISL